MAETKKSELLPKLAPCRYSFMTTLPETLLTQDVAEEASTREYGVFKRRDDSHHAEFRIYDSNLTCNPAEFRAHMKEFNLNTVKVWDILMIYMTNKTHTRPYIRIPRVKLYHTLGWCKSYKTLRTTNKNDLKSWSRRTTIERADRLMYSVIDVLANCTIAFNEKIRVPTSDKKSAKKTETQHVEVHPFNKIELTDRDLYVEFSQNFLDRTSAAPITYIPTDIFTLTGKSATTYIMAKRMAEHYYQTKNQKTGRNNVLRAGTLCKYTDLEHADTSDCTRWRSATTSPVKKLENAMANLQKREIIISWDYPAGRKWLNYEDWCESTVRFEMPASRHMYNPSADI